MNADRSLATLDPSHRIALTHVQLTERLIGVFFQVYNELGVGFLEGVYREAMAIVLTQESLRFEREVPLTVLFRKLPVGVFKPDFVVDNSVVVEIKAARRIEDCHQAQLLNYLRATSLEVGLLLNFGPAPTFKRMVFANTRKNIRVHPRQSAAQAVAVERTDDRAT